MNDYKELPYRKGAQALILNSDDEVLIVQLNDYNENEWNIPGGGRESGESAENNILREIEEELDIKKKDIAILAKSPSKNRYDFPPELQNSDIEIYRKYRGQIKDQFILLYKGNAEDIKIDFSELREYKWVRQKDLESYLVFEGQIENVTSLLAEYEKLRNNEAL